MQHKDHHAPPHYHRQYSSPPTCAHFRHFGILKSPRMPTKLGPRTTVPNSAAAKSSRPQHPINSNHFTRRTDQYLSTHHLATPPPPWTASYRVQKTKRFREHDTRRESLRLAQLRTISQGLLYGNSFSAGGATADPRDFAHKKYAVFLAFVSLWLGRWCSTNVWSVLLHSRTDSVQTKNTVLS